MDIFGDERVEPSWGSVGANTMWGSWYTCPKSGKAESISFYWNYWVSSRVKCVIYRKRDGALVGYTEEKFLGAEQNNTWQTFKIISGGALEANTDYWLLAWFESGGLRRYSSEVGKGLSFAAPYGVPPGKVDGRIINERVSIYCTYTPTVLPVEWVPTIVGGFLPIFFGLAVIGYTELTKKR
jgi:hypothetical protein